jgi:hypothetical protein
MKYNRCKNIADVQESFRSAVDDLGSDNIYDRIYALIYLQTASKQLLSRFLKNYPGIGRVVDEVVDEVLESSEDYFNDL